MVSLLTSGPKVTKATVNSAILEYLVVGALPFTHVRQDHFKKLVSTLRPNTDVLCYPTLMKMMSEAFERMVTNMKKELENVDHVCTTADLWTGGRVNTKMSCKKLAIFFQILHLHPILDQITNTENHTASLCISKKNSPKLNYHSFWLGCICK